MSPSSPALAGMRVCAPAFAYLSPTAAALAALEPRQCRWPVGEPGQGDFAFCLAQRTGHGSYCTLHATQAHSGAVQGARA